MKSSTLVRIGGWGLLGSVVFAIFPLVVAIGAGAFGSMLGCAIDESGTSVCMLFGTDIGGLLSTIGIFGWLSLVTMPIGVLTGILSLILLLVGGILYAWKRKKTA